MLILPAVDLYAGKAVRLYKGRYDEMTVYSEHPEKIAAEFAASGAQWMHMVDLEGARDGGTPNLASIKNIRAEVPLSIELGGGIRDMDTVSKYLDAGIDRVILGTAAVTDPAFAERAAARYGSAVAVGVDLLDGHVAIRGWREDSRLDGFEFCRRMQDMGIETIISTDISRDGAMQGANHALYERLGRELTVRLIASGGVSSLEDIRRLRDRKLYGAIIGKAYYTGALSLTEAIKEAGREADT